MSPAEIAEHVIRAAGIPEDEMTKVRAQLDLIDPGPHGALLELVTWLALALVGERRDVTAAILDLRRTDAMIVRYIKEVVSQADQFQEKAAPSPPELGDDPHGGR